jgi:hypothetical protein
MKGNQNTRVKQIQWNHYRNDSMYAGIGGEKMKKLLFSIFIMVFTCITFTSCNKSGNPESDAQMSMVYEDNPAFFFKDMKLIWGDTIYYFSPVINAERGKKLGYATDEYSGWDIYELKGHTTDYVIAVEAGSEDVWRVMSVNPPEKPYRQYILENAGSEERFTQLLSVTLYEDGTARLATPPISSFALGGECYYVFDDEELTVFQNEEDPLAVFAISDEKTIIFKSATVPLFAKSNAKYVCP